MKKLLLSVCLVLGFFQVKAQYPLLPIDSVQFINATRLAQISFNSPGQDNTLPDYIEPTFHNATYGDTVVVEGVVTYDPISYGLSINREAAWIQRTGNEAWSGLQIMYDSNAVPVNQNVVLFKQNMKKGRTVRVTGVIRHFQGETQLTVINVPIQVISLGPTNIAPKVLKIEDFSQLINGTQTPQFITGEQYEGVYVELQNVLCYNPTPGSGPRYTWSVQDANGNRIPIRDVSAYFRNDNLDEDPNTPVNFTPPSNGSVIPFIRGIITESGNSGFKTYNLAPLLPSDVATPIEPPSIANLYRTPAQATSSDIVKIRAEITDKGTVTKATLHYAVGYANALFKAVLMTNIGGDWYEGSVPAQADGSFVKYYVSAIDNDNFTAFFPDSASLNSGYKVVDNFNSVKYIQETPFPNGASAFTYDTLPNLNIRGLVISGIQNYDLGVIAVQSDVGPWGTIFVRFTTGDGIVNWRRGDSVWIKKAVVTERIPQGSNPFGRLNNTGITFIEEIGADGWEYLSRCNGDATPFRLPFDSLMSSTFNKEPYENLLIRLEDVYVVQKNADSIIGSNYGEFGVHPDVNASIGFRADDYSNDLFVNRVSDSLNQNGLDFLPVFQGILVSSFGNWKFLPRNRTDMSKAGNVIPPYLSLIGSDTLFILRGENMNDLGATVCDDEMGSNITVDIDSSAVDIQSVGTYEVFYNAKDPAGNEADELNRYVVVTIGSNLNTPESIRWAIYPNPADNQLFMRLELSVGDAYTLRLFDLSGKQVYARNMNLEAGISNLSIPVSGLKEGMYICQISSSRRTLSEKVTIIH